MTERRKKVYIVNDSGHNFDDAKRYGDIVVLSKGPIYILKTTQMYRVLSVRLKSSSPDDYLLVSGPCIMNVVAASIFVSLHKRLNLLIWMSDEDGVGGAYTERTLVL